MAKRTARPRNPQLELAAGEPCVAFLNTAGARPDNRQLGVTNYDEMVTWCRRIGTVRADRAEWLRRRAAERPAEAETAFAFADQSRIALAETFLAAQRQEPADESRLEAFNRTLDESSLSPRLVTAESGVTLAWVGDPDALDSLLAPILSSAYQVITAAQGQPHVRLCAAPDCPLFFIDPTGRRKWCSMKSCGNRVKTRRHYQRVLKAERQHLRKNALRKPRKRS